MWPANNPTNGQYSAIGHPGCEPARLMGKVAATNGHMSIGKPMRWSERNLLCAGEGLQRGFRRQVAWRESRTTISICCPEQSQPAASWSEIATRKMIAPPRGTPRNWREMGLLSAPERSQGDVDNDVQHKRKCYREQQVDRAREDASPEKTPLQRFRLLDAIWRVSCWRWIPAIDLNGLSQLTDTWPHASWVNHSRPRFPAQHRLYRLIAVINYRHYWFSHRKSI